MPPMAVASPQVRQSEKEKIMTTIIKMAGWKAKLFLNGSDCVVVLADDLLHYTQRGIDSCGSVYVKDIQNNVRLESIKKIEYTDRFGNTSMMEIAW
jgi:hypothetical protein